VALVSGGLIRLTIDSNFPNIHNQVRQKKNFGALDHGGTRVVVFQDCQATLRHRTRPLNLQRGLNAVRGTGIRPNARLI